MTNTLLRRGSLLAALLALTACPSGPTKCNTNAECKAGETCNPMTGTCQIGGVGGGVGGGDTGGGTGTGGGSATGGGASTGGGSATGGGMGTGGGATMSGGDTCEMAVTVGAGTVTGTTVGAANNYSPACTGYLNPGPEVVYQVTVPAGQRLKATATPTSPTSPNQFDLSLYLVRAPAANCNTVAADGGMAIMCLSASDDDTRFDATESVGWTNDTGAPVDVFVVVDSGFDRTEANPDGGQGFAHEGTYSLSITLSTPPAGDRCDSAILLTPGTPLTNQDLNDYGDDYSGLTSLCDGSRSPDVAYRVAVPAGQVLSVTVTPAQGSSFDPVLSLSDSAPACDVTCLASVDNTFDGQAETLVFKNKGTNLQEYFIVVDGYSGSTGVFSIVATLATPPGDDACQGATALTAGATLSNQTTVGYANDYETATGAVGCATSGTIGADRAYSLSVPQGHRATVTVTPTPDAGFFSPSLSLVQGPAATCDADPRVCAAGVSGGTTPRVATYTNPGTSAQELFAIVDSASTTGGSFSIGYTSAPAPVDDTCTSATTVLTVGTPASGDLAGFMLDYQTGLWCAANTLGVDRVYRLAVPNNQQLILTATPADATDGGPNLALNLFASAAACDGSPRSCIGAVNSTGRGGVETLRRSNASGGVENILVAVADTVAGTTNRAFTLSATTAAIPTGDLCQAPEALSGATTLNNQEWTNFSRVYSVAPTATGCVSYPGPERVFSISIPAGQTLTARAVRETGSLADPALNLIEGPASNCTNTPTCLASSDDDFNGAAEEVVTHTNSGASAKTVFIVVGSWGQGPFRLTVTLQ